MRAAVRLLAAVKPQFLESGAPTGLTGLFNHRTPRGTLSYLYNSTLDKLKHIPESSVYRQSTEALIKHRLSIVESFKPEGYEAWHEQVKKQLQEHKDVTGAQGIAVLHSHGGDQYVTIRQKQEDDDRILEWDGEEVMELQQGTRTEEERAKEEKAKERVARRSAGRQLEIEPEPPLNREQYVVCHGGWKPFGTNVYRIEEIETQIGAGLIEEVIQVAEGEHMLVNRMIDARM